jgi:hypothetical protein
MKAAYVAVRLVGVLVTVFALGGATCQRSPSYKKDQDYARSATGGEIPPSYYDDRSSMSPSQRVEAMGQPKKRVVIFDFWNDTPVTQKDLGSFAADELRRGLYLSQRVILPPEARSDLSTADFVQGEKVKVAQLIREARRLGVAVVAIGRVTKIVFRQRGDEVGLLRQKQSLAAVDVEMKVFDVSVGREVLASAKSGEASSNAVVALEATNVESPQYRAELTKMAVRQAVAPLVADVIKSVEKMTWQGSIAKIVGPKLYLNAGRASGLVGGDILKVVSQGDEVYDPTSGAYLGRAQGQLKGTLEVVDFVGQDAAVADVHTGANFQEGDLVQLY